ncbi:MAG: contractile injection system protein, VgrG/Pvc8 family [Caldilineaceae bacterium]
MPFTTYSARPTIRVNGQAYALVSELALGFEMSEQEGGMSSLELRLGNIASNTIQRADFAFEDDEILKLGARIAVYAGDETNPTEIFQGIITSLEADFETDQRIELVVLAEDRFQQARLERHTITYNDTTIEDLAKNLAKQLSLKPIVTGFRDSIGTQVQLNESDLAFMRRLLTRYNGDMQVVGEELHLSPRSEVQRGILTLEMDSELRRVRATADLANQVNAVTVSGWDAERGKRVNVRSKDLPSGAKQGRMGFELLRNALTERTHHIAHLAVRNESEAQALADATFAAKARRLIMVDGTAEGNPALRVGTHVKLTGLGPRFSNTYYVTQTLHRWDMERGYETDFEAECAFWGGK